MTIPMTHPMPSARMPEYDLVRAVAMVFVIAVHALYVIDGAWPGSPLFDISSRTVFFCANALFFMLSGRFAFSRAAVEQPGTCLLKKFRGICIPVILVFFLRTLWELAPHFGSPLFVLKRFLLNTLSLYSGNEYWFLFMLIPLYVATPFIARSIRGMTLAQKRLFFAVYVCYSSLEFAMACQGNELGWGYLFRAFAGTYVLGAFVEELFAGRRERHCLSLAGLISACVTVGLVWWGIASHGSGAWHTSPFYVITSIALYLALLAAGRRMKHAQALTGFVARHSFLVYLVHLPVMNVIAPYVPVHSGSGSILTFCLLVLADAAACLALSVALHYVLVTPAQKAFDALAARVRVWGKVS